MPCQDFTTRRLFLEAALEPETSVALDRTQANYLLNVLRLGEGATVLVFNGRDGEWRARLAADGRRSARLVLLERVRPQPEPPRLTYLFAPLKHARLDYVVQKAVEMGAGRIAPVMTRRTVASRVNEERMRANAVEAAEQCGVLHLPAIVPPRDLATALRELDPDTLLVFCDEDASLADPVAALAAHRATAKGCALLIGPEGGFAEEERAALLARPLTCRLALGPRILRADTAAVAALALVQAVLGDWR